MRCQSCGHVSDSGIFVHDGVDATTMSGYGGQCPACGGDAELLTGVVNVTRAGDLEMVSGPQWSWDLVRELGSTLRRVVEERPADPIAPIETVVPELGSDLRRVTAGWTAERIIALVSGILGILSFAGVDAKDSAEAMQSLMQTIAEYVANAR